MLHRDTQLTKVTMSVITDKIQVNAIETSNSLACGMTSINIQRIPDVGQEATKLSLVHCWQNPQQ